MDVLADHHSHQRALLPSSASLFSSLLCGHSLTHLPSLLSSCLVVVHSPFCKASRSHFSSSGLTFPEPPQQTGGLQRQTFTLEAGSVTCKGRSLGSSGREPPLSSSASGGSERPCLMAASPRSPPLSSRVSSSCVSVSSHPFNKDASCTGSGPHPTDPSSLGHICRDPVSK